MNQWTNGCIAMEMQKRIVKSVGWIDRMSYSIMFIFVIGINEFYNSREFTQIIESQKSVSSLKLIYLNYFQIISEKLMATLGYLR